MAASSVHEQEAVQAVAQKEAEVVEQSRRMTETGEVEAVGAVVEAVEVLEAVEAVVLPTVAPTESKDDTGGADGASAGVAKECAVCMDAEKTHVFFPCGHICVCEACSKGVMAGSGECPICRAVAIHVFRTYT